MTQTTQSVSPLRQRMIDDMMMRKLSPKTQSGYIRAVKNLARYLGHSPDTATSPLIMGGSPGCAPVTITGCGNTCSSTPR